MESTERRLAVLERELMLQASVNIAFGVALSWLWRDAASASPEVLDALTARIAAVKARTIMLPHHDPAQSDFVSQDVQDKLLSILTRAAETTGQHDPNVR